MKKIITIIIVLVLLSCVSAKNEKETLIIKKITTVLGVVIAEESEMDGAIYKIKTIDNILYSTLISIPNLGKNEYKDIQKGDRVALRGEVWEMDGKNHLTVRKVISTDTNNFIVEGVVKNIEHGKDGYEATIKIHEEEIYKVIISIPNLSVHNTYKDFKVGEVAKIKGELWMFGNENRITVREILNN